MFDVLRLGRGWYVHIMYVSDWFIDWLIEFIRIKTCQNTYYTQWEKTMKEDKPK